MSYQGVGFSSQTCCHIFRRNMQEGLSEYNKRQGPESQTNSAGCNYRTNWNRSPTYESWFFKGCWILWFRTPSVPPCLGLGPVSISRSEWLLIIYVSTPMRSNSNWRSILPMTLLPYLPGIWCWESWQVTQLQQLCEIFWLQKRSPGSIRSGKWWEGSWMTGPCAFWVCAFTTGLRP
jgi:hypothetical protein